MLLIKFLYLPGNISRSASGLKKVSSGCPGRVDFPARQVASHSHLPDGQGPKQVVHWPGLSTRAVNRNTSYS